MMTKLTIALLPLALACAACTSAEKIRSGAEHVVPTGERELLFPQGGYRHEVRLSVVQAGQSKDFDFQGAVQLKPDVIRVIVLSPLSTTLFKIVEDRKTGQVEVHSYMDALKKYEPKFQEYYGLLRLLFMTRPSPRPGDALELVTRNDAGLPLELKMAKPDASGAQARFVFTGYDAHGIPERFEIHHPRFNARIEVAGYEL